MTVCVFRLQKFDSVFDGWERFLHLGVYNRGVNPLPDTTHPPSFIRHHSSNRPCIF